MGGSQQQFYGFSAVVIPVLLFGGAVVDQWRPQKKIVSRGQASSVIAAMLFVIVAEILAIDAAFTGSATTAEGVIIVLAVVGGTVAAAGAVTWPWRRFVGRKVYKAIVVGAVLGALALGFKTYRAISTTSSDERLTQTEWAVLRIASDQRASTKDLAAIVKLELTQHSGSEHALSRLLVESRRTRADDDRLVKLLEHADIDR